MRDDEKNSNKESSKKNMTTISHIITQDEREARLDALRGIAALSVAVAHSITLFSEEPIYNKIFLDINYESFTAIFFRIIYIIFNADAAVIIFFVLSGYVLTKSLNKINTDNISIFCVYIVKRFYRIIPSVLISFIPIAYFIDRSVWEYINNMLLLKASINGVTWTLQIEIAASFLIFIIFVINNKYKILAVPLFILLIILFIIGYKPYFFMYFPAFFLGCYVENIQKIIPPNREKHLVVIAIFFLLITDFFLGYATRSAIAVITLASVIIIAFASTNTFFKFLDYKIFHFLGKISFSFYLYHFTAGLIVIRLGESLSINLRQMHQVYAALIYMVTTIPLTIGLAMVSYYLVEKPSITAGREVAHIFKSFILYDSTQDKSNN